MSSKDLSHWVAPWSSLSAHTQCTHLTIAVGQWAVFAMERLWVGQSGLHASSHFVLLVDQERTVNSQTDVLSLPRVSGSILR